MVKVSCILRHWGVQLILAGSWARPTIFVGGKGRGVAEWLVLRTLDQEVTGSNLLAVEVSK